MITFAMSIYKQHLQPTNSKRMKNLSSIKRTMAASVMLTAVMAMAPASQAEAQTSKNFGRALTKAYKVNKKELPSLVPKKEQPLPTFSGPKVRMPDAQGAKKQTQAPPSGVTLGYGNAMLFKDMDKQKQDSARNDSTELKK